jgi:chloramphenicol 3-O phosphotransferase
MRHAIAAMAGAGNNIVVDDVIFGNTADGDGHIVDDYKALLAPFEFHMVGIMAPLTILERREIARGDRMQGLARWQMDKVHRGMTYDLTIDTAKRPPQDCAQEICRVFNL